MLLFLFYGEYIKNILLRLYIMYKNFKLFFIKIYLKLKIVYNVYVKGVD